MRFAEFYFAVLFLGVAAVVSATDYCKLETDSCSCIADNGYGVDLRNISGKWWTSIDGEVPASGFLVSICKDSHTVPEFVGINSGCADGYSVSRRAVNRIIN